MIAEKSHIAQFLIDKISGTAEKVNFINDSALTKALLFLENKGIPNNKHEDYKYCNLDATFKKEFKALSQQLNAVSSINEFKLEDTLTLVVINGNYSESLSDKIILKGLHINAFTNLDEGGKSILASQANVEKDAFIAMNTAFSGQGFHLKVEKNSQLQIPIHIIYVSSSDEQAFTNPRNIIIHNNTGYTAYDGMDKYLLSSVQKKLNPKSSLIPCGINSFLGVSPIR